MYALPDSTAAWFSLPLANRSCTALSVFLARDGGTVPECPASGQMIQRHRKPTPRLRGPTSQHYPIVRPMLTAGAPHRAFISMLKKRILVTILSSCRPRAASVQTSSEVIGNNPALLRWDQFI